MKVRSTHLSRVRVRLPAAPICDPMQESSSVVLRSLARRAVRAVAAIVIVLLIGTIAFHFMEGYTIVYSFFFTSMLATGEGPPAIPPSAAGQLFASVMAFVGTGTVVVSLLFIFGPVFRRFLLMEEKVLSKDIKRFEKRRL